MWLIFASHGSNIPIMTFASQIDTFVVKNNKYVYELPLKNMKLL